MKKNFLGLGTAAIGRPQYINVRQEATTEVSLAAFRQKGIAVLNAAYNLGIRYFDTAPGYGMAEQLLLDWLIEKKDTSIAVATKWGYTYVANFDPTATQHEIKEHSLKKLNEQWTISKKLLPYLSTYQIHSATFETGVLDNESVLNRLAELKSKHGLLMGISTTGANQVAVIKKALAVKVAGMPLFDVFQVTYNLLDQSLATIAKEISVQNKRLIIKEALANGRVFSNTQFPHYAPMYATLEALSKKYEVGIDAIALRFCMDSIAPYKVLSGAATEGHLSENNKAGHFKLANNDIVILKEMAVLPEAYWIERKELAWN